jgi:hypothetical protein
VRVIPGTSFFAPIDAIDFSTRTRGIYGIYGVEWQVWGQWLHSWMYRAIAINPLDQMDRRQVSAGRREPRGDRRLEVVPESLLHIGGR